MYNETFWRVSVIVVAMETQQYVRCNLLRCVTLSVGQKGFMAKLRRT